MPILQGFPPSNTISTSNRNSNIYYSVHGAGYIDLSRVRGSNSRYVEYDRLYTPAAGYKPMMITCDIIEDDDK